MIAYRTISRTWLLLLGGMLMAGCASLLQPDVKQGLVNLKPGDYRVDPAHTTVLFKVDHLGLSQFIGRFNAFEANLVFDPQHPETARLSAIIETASIDVNDPDFEETLRGDDWFATERFPHAYFETSGAEMVDGDTLRFNGELTLLGVTSPVTLEVVFNGGADNMLTGRYTLGFDATAQFERSAFGLDKYVPMIGDRVTVEVYAEFQRVR